MLRHAVRGLCAEGGNAVIGVVDIVGTSRGRRRWVSRVTVVMTAAGKG